MEPTRRERMLQREYLRRNKRRRTQFIALGCAAAIVIAGVIGANLTSGGTTASGANVANAADAAVVPVPGAPTPSQTTIVATPASCTTFGISRPATNNWVAEGVSSIRHAKTSADAKAAAHDWLNALKHDDRSLTAAAKATLGTTVDRATLSNGNCASSTAVNLVASISKWIDAAKVTTGQAPSSGINSRMEGMQVVSYVKPGVTGDRTAIQLTGTGSTTTISVMARCGNVVTKGHKPFPPSPKPVPSQTPTPSCGCTSSPSPTPSQTTPVSTPTPTPTETSTPTSTPTETWTPTPTPTPTDSCGCTSTPTPTASQPSKPPVGKLTADLYVPNDVDQSWVDPVTGLPKDSTAVVTATYSFPGNDKGSVCMSTVYGSYPAGACVDNLSGSSTVKFTYLAPSDSTIPASGLVDTLTVTVTDTTSGQPAATMERPILINQHSSGSIPQ